jgi:hypothetical protein
MIGRELLRENKVRLAHFLENGILPWAHFRCSPQLISVTMLE